MMVITLIVVTMLMMMTYCSQSHLVTVYTGHQFLKASQEAAIRPLLISPPTPNHEQMDINKCVCVVKVAGRGR